MSNQAKRQDLRNTDLRFLQNAIDPIVIDKITEPVKRRLAQISTDEGFVAAVDLAYRSNMTSNEAFTFVTEINELRSSAKQVEFIQQRAADMTQQIGATGGGAMTRKPQGPKARVNMALGTVMNLPDDLDHHRCMVGSAPTSGPPGPSLPCCLNEPSERTAGGARSF